MVAKLAATATIGDMRQIIRGIAQIHADPVLMLNAADRALRLEHPDLFVTAFVGVLDPIIGTLTYASAGHPAPYTRLPDGRLELLVHTGLPLGLRHGQTASTTSTARLHEGAPLVLYTDGLTEDTRDLVEGERRLERALEREDLADVSDAEIVGGELIGIVRYAPGIAEVTVDWSGPLPQPAPLENGA